MIIEHILVTQVLNNASLRTLSILQLLHGGTCTVRIMNVRVKKLLQWLHVGGALLN